MNHWLKSNSFISIYGLKTSENHTQFDNAVNEAWFKKNFEPLGKHYKNITAKIVSGKSWNVD